MHELGVVFNVLDQVRDCAKENNISHVNKVTLQIGEVSTVIPKYLEDIWIWAVEKEELIKGCKLKIERIEAITYCEDCKSKYSTVKYGKTCPNCKSDKTYLIQGNEFIIKEIEAV